MSRLRTAILGAFLSTLLAPSLHATDHFVSPTGGNNPPFLTWSDAATNIQDAIDSAIAGDTVWVTNGVYTFGGKVMAGDLTNRVTLDKALTVQSINGPFLTTIQGVGTNLGTAAVRCAWLTNGAVLKGFTLQGGATRSSGDAVTLLSGGGVWCSSSNAMVANCLITSNRCSLNGGGAYQGTLNTCAVIGNAGFNGGGGGGVSGANLNNCTVCSNSYPGVGSSRLTNCIVYFNTVSNYVNGGVIFSYCCTFPLPVGIGNISSAPGLAPDSIHFFSSSPCRGAGTNLVTGTDIYGQPWANPPSIGCYEWNPLPMLLGPPAIHLNASPLGMSLNAVAVGQNPFTCWWTRSGVLLEDDGHYSSTQTTNLVVAQISPSDVGTYQVIISNAFGMATSAMTSFAIHYVDPASATPAPPYLNWASAATNIQDAIDAAPAGDAVWVTNGVYVSGGRVMVTDLTNRVALNKAIAVKSVNGPFVTAIQGNGPNAGPAAVRCAWLTNGAILSGFALRAGAGRTVGNINLDSGAAVWSSSSNSIIENCIITSNAVNSSSDGVVYQGVFNNCLVSGNSGRASMNSFFNDCTIVSNSLVIGGAFTNCIVYYNGGVNYSGSTLTYCCTTPLPSGPGNFTSAPLLLPDGFHLASASPCVATGTNLAAGTDIEGRAWSNPPSVGCSQWQPAPVVFSAPKLQITNTVFGFNLSAGADGAGPLTYFWLRDGVPLENDGHYSSVYTTNLFANGFLPSDVGNYQLVASNAFGMATSAVFTLEFAYHCVDAAGSNPTPPYSSWATAATNIQDAIDAALPGDYVIVTNGLYNSGGKVMAGDLLNRIAVTNAITVCSVNGPGATTIQGLQTTPAGPGYGALAIRCAWLTNGATLAGFTINYGNTRTNGDLIALQSGGSIWAASANAYILNCVISNSSARYEGGACYQGTLKRCKIFYSYAASVGGACYQSSLQSCFLANNQAATYGGGAYGGSLTNCTLAGNVGGSTSGSYGSGSYNSTAQNCIFYGNDCVGFSGTASYCCAYFSSLPGGGTGNIFAFPQFLDGFHIAATSACRHAGSSFYTSGTDIDGEPWANPPSIGCDEVLDADLVGPLIPTILTNSPAAVPGKLFGMSAQIVGQASRIAWDFGDGIVSNSISFSDVTHAWTNLGSYTVTLTAFNNDYPAGVSTTIVVPIVPLAPPLLSLAPVFNNQILVNFDFQAGVSYTLQYTTNLTPPAIWQNDYTVSLPYGGPYFLSDFMKTNQNRFYRVWAH